MYVFLLVVHILAAVLLVVAILVQRGRGGGLLESFAGVESMFGTKTSEFLTRITAAFAIIFLFTSVSLALLAARRGRSLIDEKAVSLPQQAAERAAEDGLPAKEDGLPVVPEPPPIQEETTQQESIPD